MFGIVVGSLVAALGVTEIPQEALWLGGLTALVASVSYMDDRRHLPIGIRLVAHFAVAALLSLTGTANSAAILPGLSYSAPGWLVGTVSVLFTVWMINLYNFMDGMDGFAGGMTAIGFAMLALFGWMNGDVLFATLNLVIAAAAGGFLVFNFPPARIFMGDAGSSALGFLAAGMALWGNASGTVPLWMALLVFSPFIVDATITLLRRMLCGEKVWRAHKTHYYQRLVQAGWGHRKTVLLEYALMVACAGAALAARSAGVWVQWALIAAVVVLYLAFFSFVRAAENGAKFASRRRH